MKCNSTLTKINSNASFLALSIAAGLASQPMTTHAADFKLEEIVVTATKRSESLQDVPIAIQALGSEDINDLNIGSFDDYIQSMPNVTSGGRGPGQNTVYIRGLATTTTRIVSAESTGSAPNVALYLDEAPVTAGGRNLDIYVTDMERIEVLAGPQGTLFGASAQGGALRLITRKPVIDEFEGGVKAKYSNTSQGGDSSGTEAFINIPVIDGKMAVRGVVYNINEGGYIDNVPTTFSVAGNPGTPASADVQSISNQPLVEDDFNTTSYKGIRLSAKYLVDDDWSALMQITQQTLKADGVFDHDPDNVGELEVARVLPDELEDRFTQYAWTIEGRVGALEMLYTGSYLDRTSSQSVDYSAYTLTGPFIPYYVCNYPSYTKCGDPRYGIINEVDNTRTTHELRFLTPQDEPIRAVVGAFYDDVEITLLSDAYIAGTIGNGFPLNAQIPGSTINAPGPRPEGVNFFNDMFRTESQKAVFGEVTFDLSDTLSFTAGARWYDIDVGLVGSANFGLRGATDSNSGINLDETTGGKPINESDTIFKGNLTYQPSNELMFYLTHSEGFRPGLVNRIPGNGVPEAVKTDNVTNYELGWKLSLVDDRLRFNGALYRIDWEDIQIAIQDPSISFLAFGANVGSAEINGIEGDISFAATENLTLFTAFSYNDTELTEVPTGGTIEISPVGSELALTPKYQVSSRARYEWQLDNEYSPYAQLSAQYADRSYSSVVTKSRFKQDSYVLANAAIGINNDADNWGLELYVENLTDKRAEFFINDQDVGVRITTPRPRTIGLRFNLGF